MIILISTDQCTSVGVLRQVVPGRACAGTSWNNLYLYLLGTRLAGQHRQCGGSLAPVQIRTKILRSFRQLTCHYTIWATTVPTVKYVNNASTHSAYRDDVNVGIHLVRGGRVLKYTMEPGYNDIGLCDTSSITSDILWYQLVPHC